MGFVVDASVAVGWFVRSQSTPLTAAAGQAVVADFGSVPSHFGIEVARALRRHERRQLIAPEIVDEALASLRDLPLIQDRSDTLDIIETVVALARRYTLRIADAAYLELALRTGLPLATRDASLTQAAKAAGVALFAA